ncbi:MAG: ParB N-terminal domain-containing protein [Desulfopila sp.]
MKTSIKLIKVDKEVRIRYDIGDLEPLIDSISKVGLINPIVIDEDNNLVAGYRRLEACKKLGFKEVDVKIVDFNGDHMKMLDVEVAENFFRKDFTPEEVLASEKRRQEILESRRKKGLLERFLLWLKGLFTSKPAVDKTPHTPAEPQTDRRDAAAESPEDSSSTDKQDEQKEPVGKNEEQEQEISRQSTDTVAEAEEEVGGTAPPQAEQEKSSVQKKSGAETANPSKGERPITWRTS